MTAPIGKNRVHVSLSDAQDICTEWKGIQTAEQNPENGLSMLMPLDFFKYFFRRFINNHLDELKTRVGETNFDLGEVNVDNRAERAFVTQAKSKKEEFIFHYSIHWNADNQNRTLCNVEISK
jgi:hypothetical protein